jgi:hypothetical protein
MFFDDADNFAQNKEENKIIAKNVSNLIAMREIIRCDEKPILAKEDLEIDRDDFKELKDIMDSA